MEALVPRRTNCRMPVTGAAKSEEEEFVVVQNSGVFGVDVVEDVGVAQDGTW